MPALSNVVTTTTQTRLLPKVIDNILNGNVLLMRLLRNSVPWMGGTSIDISVELSAVTAKGSYFGFDTLSTTQENIRQRAVFDPSQEYASVPLSNIQMAVNRSDAAKISLVAAEMDFRTRSLRDEMGDQLYLDGTGNNSKDLLGLVAAVDDSTNVTTYGGISRATFTNWRATLTAQAGALSLANLAADFDAAQIADDMPTLIVCPPAVWTIYEALLTPTVQHNAGVSEFRITAEGSRQIDRLGGNQGFRALAFRGIPVVSDEKCTANNLYTLNEKHLTFYTIDQEEGRSIKNGFGWTGFKEAINQDAVVGQLLWYGQLISDSPRTHARRTGITT